MKSKLIQSAIDAKEIAYAPYSKFQVGAALLTEDDEIIIAANVENASYGLTMCAERIAAFKAYLDGKRKFKAIAVAGNTKEPLPPCGACRQVLLELCGSELDVIMINGVGQSRVIKLKDMLPYSFESNDLKI